MRQRTTRRRGYRRSPGCAISGRRTTSVSSAPAILGRPRRAATCWCSSTTTPSSSRVGWTAFWPPSTASPTPAWPAASWSIRTDDCRKPAASCTRMASPRITAASRTRWTRASISCARPTTARAPRWRSRARCSRRCTASTRTSVQPISRTPTWRCACVRAGSRCASSLRRSWCTWKAGPAAPTPGAGSRPTRPATCSSSVSAGNRSWPTPTPNRTRSTCTAWPPTSPRAIATGPACW